MVYYVGVAVVARGVVAGAAVAGVAVVTAVGGIVVVVVAAAVMVAAVAAALEAEVVAVGEHCAQLAERQQFLRPAGIVEWPDELDDAVRARLLARVPAGRAGTPDDVVQAVLTLIRSGYMNGTVLTIDGGRLAATGEGG